MVIPIPARRPSQVPLTTTGSDYHWGLKMQSDANTKMKSRINCFSHY